MKKIFMLGTGLLLSLSIIPGMAVADSSTFHALSKMSMEERGALTPIGDNQLATVEGGRMIPARMWARTIRGIRSVSLSYNYAVVTQTNICVNCVTQTNTAIIYQQIGN